MPTVLIVAYGNPLRSDDGVAWHAADALEGKIRGVEILRLHQLAPELAETASCFDTVIFVDAASSPEAGDPGEIRSEELDGNASISATAFSHAVSPRVVIRLAKSLYGASPRGYSVTITGQKFDHGESLSPVVASALPEVLVQIEQLIRDAGKAR
jgi:hydrogenase maturation protease